MRQMVPLEEANDLLLQLVHPLEEVEVDLLEAQGMVLARDVAADRPFPPFDSSPLDGFALRAADTAGVTLDKPCSLQVIETIGAGHAATHEVAPGTAIGIATGAPVPQGADCVVRFEDTRRDGERVLVQLPLSPGQNVVRTGKEFASGTVLLNSGQTIDPAAIGILAAVGRRTVAVHKRPRVAVFSTGDELVLPGQVLPFGKIFASNRYAVAAQVTKAGGQPILLDSAPDLEDAVASSYRQGLTQADIVISTGGASVGRRDVIKSAMRKAGAEIIFWKAAFKPGTAVVFGLSNAGVLAGLSGNPTSGMVTFALLVRPLLRRLGGHRELFLPRLEGYLSQDYPKGAKARHFVQARTWWQNQIMTCPVGLPGTGAFRSTIDSNSLIDLPAGHGPLQAGERVSLVLLGQLLAQ
ncbi:MAG: molybdopterin molybdotransferase MoeA [Desulfotomaculaceae bacterium]|nr:molybdopterin molybdotransferase MoeA [Desulfotomaculaceae bacterium]